MMTSDCLYGKKINSLPKIRKLLSQKLGIPEPLLGRLSDIILMKPTLSHEVPKITRKILNEQLQLFKDREINIRYQPGFVEKFSDLFFTHSQGGRSVRNIIEFQLRSAISKLIIDAGGADHVRGRTIYISLHDNKPERLYVRPSDPDRKITVKVRLRTPEKDKDPLLTTSVDVTEFAKKVHYMSKKYLLTVAFHEAGHAVYNKPWISKQNVVIINVLGQGDLLGYSSFEDNPKDPLRNLDRENVIHLIAGLFAGRAAQELAGFLADTGWSNDLERARSLAQTYLIKAGLVENMQALRTKVDEVTGEVTEFILSSEKEREVENEIQKLFDEAMESAKEELRKEWSLVRSIVYKLFKEGVVKGEELVDLRSLHRFFGLNFRGMTLEKESPSTQRNYSEPTSEPTSKPTSEDLQKTQIFYDPLINSSPYLIKMSL